MKKDEGALGRASGPSGQWEFIIPPYVCMCEEFLSSRYIMVTFRCRGCRGSVQRTAARFPHLKALYELRRKMLGDKNTDTIRSTAELGGVYR